MSSFKDLCDFYVWQKPKGVTHSCRRTRQRERACSTPTTCNSFGLLLQGYSERNTHKSVKDDI